MSLKQIAHEFVNTEPTEVREYDLKVGELFRFADPKMRRDVLRKTRVGFVTLTGEESGVFCDSENRSSRNEKVYRVEVVEPIKFREIR